MSATAALIVGAGVVAYCLLFGALAAFCDRRRRSSTRLFDEWFAPGPPATPRIFDYPIKDPPPYRPCREITAPFLGPFSVRRFPR